MGLLAQQPHVCLQLVEPPAGPHGLARTVLDLPAPRERDAPSSADGDARAGRRRAPCRRRVRPRPRPRRPRAWASGRAAPSWPCRRSRSAPAPASWRPWSQERASPTFLACLRAWANSALRRPFCLLGLAGPPWPPASGSDRPARNGDAQHRATRTEHALAEDDPADDARRQQRPPRRWACSPSGPPSRWCPSPGSRRRWRCFRCWRCFRSSTSATAAWGTWPSRARLEPLGAGRPPACRMAAEDARLGDLALVGPTTRAWLRGGSSRNRHCDSWPGWVGRWTNALREATTGSSFCWICRRLYPGPWHRTRPPRPAR